MSDVPPPRSPIDTMDVPEQLTARVVMPGVSPAIHGYALDTDLAPNYSFAETILTALTGEAPERPAGRCFEVALIMASAITVAEAPSHAAVLASLCGGKPAGVASTGAIALTQQAQAIVASHIQVLDWLNNECREEPPASFCAEPCPRVEQLRRLVADTQAEITALCHPLTWQAALFAVMHYCGLTQPWQLELALANARWPVAVAEAMAARPAGLRSYPIRTPPFQYKSTGGSS